MKRYGFVVWIVCATALGCAGTAGHLAKPGKEIKAHGLLAAGAECPMLETSDGHRYALAGSLESFKTGDRVCVRGKVAGASICMAGEATLTIESIEAESACR
ncbi:MAG TPA: DUF5818 domain-containing protein [Candidatus Eisenbacteria bacterium]|nr:DUF5818 domain-containing protein [Candidatus Eisenbacteria bacterium]